MQEIMKTIHGNSDCFSQKNLDFGENIYKKFVKYLNWRNQVLKNLEILFIKSRMLSKNDFCFYYIQSCTILLVVLITHIPASG